MSGRAVRVVAIVSLLAAVGCVGFRGPHRVSRDVAAELDLRLDKQFGFTARRGALWIARAAIRQADDPDLPSLEGVRRIQVGVYEVRGPARTDRTNPLCGRRMPGWQPVVRVCETEEDVLLLVDADERGIREMLLLARDEEELVVVTARGRLDDLIEDVARAARGPDAQGSAAGSAMFNAQE